VDVDCCDGFRCHLAHRANPPYRRSSILGLRTRLESELNALGALAEQYRLEHGDFPDVAAWRRLADREDPRFYDPWGRAYRYERTADGVTIRTLGRDGVDSGMGMDADLSAHFSSTAT
jgi:Type II secretion system (T2SS), protein G